VLLVYAKAVEERCEDVGIGSSGAYMLAGRSMSDAIALDAARHPYETTWVSV